MIQWEKKKRTCESKVNNNFSTQSEYLDQERKFWELHIQLYNSNM